MPKALIISVRPHEETGAILKLLSEEGGLITGYLAGGMSRRYKPFLQPAHTISYVLTERENSKMGRLSIEGMGSAHDLLDQPLSLLMVQSACALIGSMLNEDEQAREIYDGFETVLAFSSDLNIWPALYVRFELGLLASVGLGLDLDTCCVSGKTQDLGFVSPKSGRAVSQDAALPYVSKLLRLPSFLVAPQTHISGQDIIDGLRLSSFFLIKRVFDPLNRPLPEPRTRLESNLSAHFL